MWHKNASDVHTDRCTHCQIYRGEGVPHLDRFDRSLSPSTDTPRAPQVSSFLPRGEALPIPSPSLRSLNGVRGIHKAVGEPSVLSASAGDNVHPYLDDLLIQSPSRTQTHRDPEVVIHCLEEHGFLINRSKSHLVPRDGSRIWGWSSTLERWGSSWRQRGHGRRWNWPHVWRHKLTQTFRHWLPFSVFLQQTWTVFIWAAFTHRSYSGSWSPTRITSRTGPPCRFTFRYRSVKACAGGQCTPIWPRGNRISGMPTEGYLVTDASLYGWGALWNEVLMQGKWSEAESRLLINLLEFRAVHLALSHWKSGLQGKHVLIRTENIAAKSHITNRGSRSTTVHKEATLLFHWAEKHLASIHAEHIRGRDNLGADWLSRQDILAGGWALNRDVFKEIVNSLGNPKVDLFASAHNCQLPRFFSRYHHPQAEGMNALTSPWPSGLLYAFPPIRLFPKVIRKIRQQRVRLILVAPWWPRRPWFLSLHVMSVRDPIRLPQSGNLLHQGPVLHPHPRKLQLTTWLLNGDNC